MSFSSPAASSTSSSANPSPSSRAIAAAKRALLSLRGATQRRSNPGPTRPAAVRHGHCHPALNSILSLAPLSRVEGSKDGLRRVAILLLAFTLPVSALACDTNDSPSATSTQSPGVTPNVQVTLPPGSTQPAGSASDEPVAFQTADGATLRGHLYAPAGAKRKVLVLASTQPQSTWKPYVAEFTGKGVALLTFDPRGVGETSGARNDAMNDDDFALAIGFIKSRDYPQVYVMGIGAPVASAAFVTAGAIPVQGVAALPAGSNTPAELMRITAPKLYLAFESDTESVANINRVVTSAPEPNTRVIVPTSSAQTPSAQNPQARLDVLAIPIVRQAILDFVTK